MEQKPASFASLLQATRFLSSCVDLYGVANGRLDPAAANDGFIAFFARDFIRNRGWAIFPLWEGDITTLRLYDGSKIPFLKLIRRRCLDTGGRFLHVAAIAKSELLTSPGATALTIGEVALDLETQDPADLFKLNVHGGKSSNVPYWGDNFLWPSNDRFVIYTNGDQAAFFAGDRQEVVDLLGVSYDYCVKRITEAHVNLKGAQTIAAIVSLCQEFSM